MAVDSQLEPITKPTETGRKEHKSHPRLIVFLVCLAISIFMWLFIELMKDYTDEIKYNVNFINAPKDMILTNSGESLISVQMKAQGFELLAAKYARNLRTLTIDLSTLKIRSTADGYSAYLPTARLMEQLGNQIRFDKEITFVKPDTLFFRFSEIFRKQVPVKPDISYSLNGQYDITDSVDFKPEMITVSSIKSIIDTLSFVKTEKLNLSQLDSSVRVRVAIFKGSQASLLKYSTDSVTITINVEKVTEAAYTIPLTVEGNGENVKIFPDKVEITCRVPLSVFPRIEASGFSAEVQYQPSQTKDKKLKVTMVRIPEKVKILKIQPAEVEYIIIAK